VNATNEYVSKNPHLVVAQLDWIQTRYLFVQTHADNRNNYIKNNTSEETVPANPIKQDGSYTPRGVGGPLIIPQSAISSQRGIGVRTTDQPMKRRKTSAGTSVTNPIDLDAEDDSFSIATFEDDRKILEEDADVVPEPEDIDTGMITPAPSKGKGKAKVSLGLFSKFVGSKSSAPAHSLTDYVSGKLDYSQLPMLAQPAWATPSATRRLMQDFKSVIAIQKNTPLHELGWHIDEDKIENMYQWIIELHSFDPTLPLAQDMVKKGIKSIVLEMRFGKDYPMSPPFVRVIRPRFLGFQQGGGGHVTAGGAMCMEVCIPLSLLDLDFDIGLFSYARIACNTC
jgi:ubiquitin-conjugating enzyme E2 Q